MTRPPVNGPRLIKLTRRERRVWADGDTKRSFLISVPNEIADQVDPDTVFAPLLLKDGSIMFKRWDKDAFQRWLEAQVDLDEE